MFFSPQRYVLLTADRDTTTEQCSATQDTKSSIRRSLGNPVLIALLLSSILNMFLVIDRLRLLGKSATIGRTAYGTSHLRLHFSF